jgi:HK97 family phage major capsid protein/HK97 family phage prohead protease
MTDLTRRDFNAPLQLLADRGVAGVVSSSALDAYGEQIDPRGVRWRDGVKLLWSHDPRQPIGRAERIAVEGDKVVANFRLASPGVDPTADRAHGLLKDGIIDSFSVGGIPHRWQGNTVTDFEIVEVSLVSVPANPDAQVTSIRSATDYMPAESDLKAAGNPRSFPAPAIRGEPRAWSFGKCLALLDGVPTSQVDWTFEREISDQLSKAVPTDRSGGLRVPLSVMLRAIGTVSGDAGASLAGTDWRPELFGLDVEAVKPALIMGRAGAKIISSDLPLVVVPRQSAPLPDAVWLARDAAMTAQADIGTRSIDLVPHTVASYHQIKRSALLYSQPSVYNLYLQQITQKQLLAVDKAILYGTGVAPQPSGVVTSTRTQVFQFGAGTATVAPTLSDFVTMASMLEGSTVPPDNRGWIMNPTMRSTLQATRKLTGSTDSVTILGEGDTTLLGYPITTGPQIPLAAADGASDIWFADYGQCGICLFAGGTATILPNPYGSMFSAGGTELAIFQDVDVFVWDAYRFVHSTNAKSIGKVNAPTPAMARGGSSHAAPAPHAAKP